MDTLSYGEFSEAFQGRLAGRRLPLNGTIEVTRRCPLTCLHCYNNLPMGDGEARSRELDYDEHCRLLDELADAGCLWLLYTGGEIFARRDFLDIYTYAKKKGFLITLFTNGTLITERIADHLVAWRPFAIEITLYGLTKDDLRAAHRHSRGRSTSACAASASCSTAGCRSRSRPSRSRPTGTRSRRCSASSRTSSASNSSSIR